MLERIDVSDGSLVGEGGPSATRGFATGDANGSGEETRLGSSMFPDLAGRPSSA
jgi:hypothetical protein